MPNYNVNNLSRANITRLHTTASSRAV